MLSKKKILIGVMMGMKNPSSLITVCNQCCLFVQFDV